MEHVTGPDDPRIRERALALWEREGRPEGRHLAHWEQAAREIAEEDTALGPDALGPDSGIQVPDSASERSLHEAAEQFRRVNDETKDGGLTPRPLTPRPSSNPKEVAGTGWAGTRS